MALNWPSKGPTELLDYQINWAAALALDTILTSAWTISPVDLVNDHATNTAVTATIWLKNGTVGQSYAVNNTITTAGGRTFDQTVNLSVQNK